MGVSIGGIYVENPFTNRGAGVDIMPGCKQGCRTVINGGFTNIYYQKL